MATLTSQDLDVNTPLVHDAMAAMVEPMIATPYFEDYLFKIVADIAAVNDEVVSGSVTDGANVGGFAEVFQEKNGSILEFRTLQSSDASVTITQNADDIDLRAASGLSGTVNNSILTYNLGSGQFTELPEFLVSFVGGVITIQQEDSIGALVDLLISDGDGATQLFYDDVAHFATDAFGANIPTTGAFTIPVGTTAQEPAAANGMMRYDSTTNELRAVQSGAWVDVIGGGGSLPVPTVNNSILTGDLGGGDFDELTEVTIAWTAGVMTVQVEDDLAALQDVIVADADGEMEFYYDGDQAFGTDVFGLSVFGVGADTQPRINFLDDFGGTQVGNIRATSTGFVVDNRRNGTVILRALDAAVAVVNLFEGDPDGAVELYFDNNITMDTRANGIGVRDDVGDNPAIDFIQDDGTTQNATLVANGTSNILALISEINSATIELRGDDAGGTEQTPVFADPDADVQLEFDGTVVFATTQNGIAVYDSAGGNDPLIELIDNFAGGSRNAFINGNSIGLFLENEVHGMPVTLRSEDAGGTVRDLVSGDPDDSTDLYFASETNPSLATHGSGVSVRDANGAGGAADAPFLELENADGSTRYAFIQANASTSLLRFISDDDSMHFEFAGDDSGGVDATMVEMDPDGPVDLYFDNDLVVETADEGLRIIPSTGDATISGNGQIWYDDSGLDTFRARVAGINADLPQLTQDSFTPVLTFATPGDLAVTYITQVGYYWRIGNVVFFRIEIQTSAFTHTTAAGNVRITGLPFAVDTTNGNTPIWECQIGKLAGGWGTTTSFPVGGGNPNIVLSDYYMVKAFGTNNQSYVEIFADGPDIGSLIWSTARIPTTTLVSPLRIYGFYETDAAIT